MFKKVLTFIAIICCLSSIAQKSTISGHVKDASSGEELMFATIYIDEVAKGVTTNTYGFYSITLPNGAYTVKYSFVGLTTVVKKINLTKDISLDIELASESNELEEVTVTKVKDNENITDPQMGNIKLDMEQLEKIPVIFGEKDVIKALQLMPGVNTAGEGSSGFYVRGGSADQNLIWIDEAPVYNASHLLGFFSVFNTDALKDVNLYKSAMSPKYGGRLSSVLDVTMNNGNMKKWNFSGGLGLISSRLTVEGPLKKDKGSIIISGRRSYADLFLRASSDPVLKETQTYFYDINAKMNYKIGKKDRIFASMYYGKDVMKYADIFGFDWANATATLRWNHLFGKKLFSNTSIVFSDYAYGININSGGNKLDISSGIRDLNAKMDFTYYLNPNNTLSFGISSIFHHFTMGKLIFESNEALNNKLPNRDAFESGIYVSNKSTYGNHWALEYGIRLSMFNAVGPGESYNFNDNGDLLDTKFNEGFKQYKTYYGWEPRVGVNYIINEKMSIKAGYNRNYQYLHLLSNSTSSQPTDLWVPSSERVKPQIADQISLGYFVNFGKDNMFEAYVDLYYKNYTNLVDYKNGADVLFNKYYEGDLAFGKGYSVGAEFFVKKRKGRFTGWIGYTISRTRRTIPGINDGKEYSARQDRTHDISVVLMFDINKRISISTNFVFYTGDAVTWPAGKYSVDGNLVPLYAERNAYRMPNYHRMDLGLTIQGREFLKKRDENGALVKKRFRSTYSVSIYNVYAHQNAYTIDFEPVEGKPFEYQAKQLALFSIVPSFTWNFKFR
jgi:hypothetical protein